MLPSTKRHLSHCQGYLELGMKDDAHDELEKIEWEDRLKKEVLSARIQVYIKAKYWELVGAIAKQLSKRFPEESEWWLYWAYGARRAKSLDQAKGILLEALKRFPDNATILYNLGCYACVDESYDIASALVKRAIELDKDFQSLAIADKDLANLWENVESECDSSQASKT